MDDGPYGRLFEPDPPAGAEAFRGQVDAVRPMVLARYYPVPEFSRLPILCFFRETHEL